MIALNKIALVLCGVLFALVAAGCSSDDNRTVTKEEIQAADAKRLDYIDKLNVPESQKAQMKAHMGGPAVPSPADQAAQAHSESQAGRRN
jgi:hypothetical protein